MIGRIGLVSLVYTLFAYLLNELSLPSISSNTAVFILVVLFSALYVLFGDRVTP